jgi:hypothetical protein
MQDGTRLAFRGNTVVETTHIRTGETPMRKMPKAPSHLPAGVSRSPKGDLGLARQKEYATMKGFKSGGDAVAASKRLPARTMQLPK